MKAKEYAEKYKSDPTLEKLAEIAMEFIFEIKKIAEVRHVKIDIGMIAILKEIIDKWHAFVRLTGDPRIKKEGLKNLILKEFPFLTEDQLK